MTNQQLQIKLNNLHIKIILKLSKLIRVVNNYKEWMESWSRNWNLNIKTEELNKIE